MIATHINHYFGTFFMLTCMQHLLLPVKTVLLSFNIICSFLNKICKDLPIKNPFRIKKLMIVLIAVTLTSDYGLNQDESRWKSSTTFGQSHSKTKPAHRS